MGIPDTVAIVAAGGSGSRLPAAEPKQFLELSGKPLLAHTVARLEESELVGRLVLVLPREGFEGYRERMTPWLGKDKFLEIVPGGESRQQSVWAGLSVIPPTFEGLALVHDGARPLVSRKVIRDVIEAAERFGGALAALPVEETLKEVGSDTAVSGTVDRQRFYRAQTPQCFRYGILRRAFDKARADGFVGTDEAQLVERLGSPVRVVPGSVRNLKVTTREHLALAEYYLTLEAES